MKKFTLLILLTSIIQTAAISQSCLPEGITFTTQVQVDSFAINYPNCTEIEGEVKISSFEITNLNGLNTLNVIHGSLWVENCYWLSDLSGLENLTEIGEHLSIRFCDKLESLNGLDNLSTIDGSMILFYNISLSGITGLGNLKSIGGNMSVGACYNLESFLGLEKLTRIGDSLTIYKNHGLTSLNGLNNLSLIGGSLKIGRYDFMGDIEGNSVLKSMQGLENLTSIGGDLYIIDNSSLTTMAGLEKLDKSTINNLTIIENDSLSTCELENICEYLSDPNGVVTIYNNAPGCNNPAEIAGNCDFTMNCLPYGDYFFFKQKDIDEFQSNYPDCTDLKGDVELSGDSILNLNGLSSINSIGGDLRFSKNYSLPDLTGIHNLLNIGGDLFLRNNDSLKNLLQLSNLGSIGGSLRIEYNEKLKSLIGLEEVDIINENLYVYGNDSLSSLHGLDNISEVKGDFYMHRNPSLTSLSGLDNLTSIGGYLDFHQQYGLIDLSALKKLSTIGGDFILSSNYKVPNLSGFESLKSVGKSLWINNYDNLVSLSGLNNLTSIGEFLQISENESLKDLTDLSTLTSIGGNLIIIRNDKLTSLNGLENIESHSIKDLIIFYNTALSECEVKSMCNYLENPNGMIEIYMNNTGCNTQEEIEEACDASTVLEVLHSDNLSIHPNPFSNSTTIEYELKHPETVLITFYNQFGKQVDVIEESQQRGLNKVVWTPGNLAGGVYYFRLQAGEQVGSGKIVLIK